MYLSVVGQRSVAACVLAMLYVLAGLTAVAAAIFPVSPAAPITLALVLGGIEIAVGVALATFRDRLHPVALHLALVGSTLLVRARREHGFGHGRDAVRDRLRQHRRILSRLLPSHTRQGLCRRRRRRFCLGTVAAGVGNLPIVSFGVGMSAVLAGELLGR